MGPITAVFGLIAFSIYAIGARLFFIQVNGEVDIKMKALVVFHGASAIYFCWRMYYSEGSILSIIVFALAIVIFLVTIKAIRNFKLAGLSCAFTEDEPTVLVTSGSYRWVRNPFYTSYLISFIAPYFATQDYIGVVLFIILCVFYIMATKQEEDKFRRSSLADEYEVYFNKTGRFLPKLF